jgi:hypothetical protein
LRLKNYPRQEIILDIPLTQKTQNAQSGNNFVPSVTFAAEDLSIPRNNSRHSIAAEGTKRAK